MLGAQVNMVDNQVNNFYKQIQQIKRLVIVVEKDIKKKLYDTDINDLTLAEIGILDVIGIGSEKTIKEIADALSVALSTPTKTMDRLVIKGYILRETSSEDRRMVVSKLTEKGEKAMVHINNMRDNNIKKAMSVLSEEELDNFSLIINKLIRNI